MTDRERMLEGLVYDPFKVDDGAWEKSRPVLERFNALDWTQREKGMDLLREIFGHIGSGCMIVPPFYCDKGSQIHIGDNFYANTGLLILDKSYVRIGSNVQMGPRVSIYTAGHPLDASIRRTGLEYARPVNIGDDVWIGGNTVINPGVSIGKGSVIGSGSVVTKDVPEGVVAAGNPCRVIRKLSEEDSRHWQTCLEEYRKDKNR